MPVRMIAFDLDDTLLRDDRTISREDLEAIQEARARGIAIVPASGRRYNSMADVLIPLAHEGPVITLNGARVLSHPSKEPLFERFIEPELCIEAIRIAKEFGVYLQLYMDENFEFEADCEESRLYNEISGSGGRAVGDLEEFIRKENRPSQKMLFIVQDERKMAALQPEVERRMGGRLSIFRSKSFYLEMTHPEVDKGAALKRLCERMNIAAEDVMAIGDGENDISMLSFAGFGVAMANSSDSVRASVRYHTDSNMQSGVGNAIRRYALST